MTVDERVAAAVEASHELATHPQSASHLDAVNRYLRGCVAPEPATHRTVGKPTRPQPDTRRPIEQR